MKTPSLFDTWQLNDIHLKNRIVMAPMTRARALQPGNIPSALMANYYQQRASAGLFRLLREIVRIKTFAL